MAAAALAELASGIGILVAQAAGLLADEAYAQHAGSLVAAYFRMTEEEVRNDPGCEAKIALVVALDRMQHHDERVLLDAIRRRQMEPGFGPPQDTAAPLRAAAGLALVRSLHPAAPRELGRLLADPEPAARRAAAQAMGGSGSTSYLAALHHKLRQVERDPDVLQECLFALWQIEGEESLGTLRPPFSPFRESR